MVVVKASCPAIPRHGMHWVRKMNVSHESQPWTEASAGMTVRGLACTQLPQKLSAITIKRFSDLIARLSCSPLVISSSKLDQFIKFRFRIQMQAHCREWLFVLNPDRFTRPIGHSCCFETWINTLSSITLKFIPMVAFSRPLCDLPLCGSRRATF